MANTHTDQSPHRRGFSKWLIVGVAWIGMSIPWSVATADCPYVDDLSLGPNESTLSGSDTYRACEAITLLGAGTLGRRIAARITGG